LKAHHWFSGAGMAHGLKLRNGRAEWFRSRYVVDNIVSAVKGVPALPGPGAGDRDGPVNTNIIAVGGKLVASIEAGNLPVELTYELESVARTDFGGTLEAGFSGHTKEDPITGEQHVLTYEESGPIRYVSIVRRPKRGSICRICR
jgi:carotenoid cleavage dioxygenase-like enzyme